MRAFSYFSHLANIAEDQNNIRQMRARSGRQGRAAAGALAETLAHAQAAGIGAADLRSFFKDALVSPVLTAHPTEVRRKSTMDREMEVAALLDRRERVQLTPEEAEASDEQLRREVLTLWQTNLLRRTKLTVLDEVANGLSFYDYTFLREVPRLICALEDRLNGGEAGAPASSPRSCGWEAGSAATATAIRSSPPTSCAARCSCSRAACCSSIWKSCTCSARSCRSRRISPTSPRSCARWRERSPDTSPHRSGEPYRLAVSGIYARLTATAERLEVEITRRPVGEGAPYAERRRNCRPISTCWTAR